MEDVRVGHNSFALSEAAAVTGLTADDDMPCDHDQHIEYLEHT